MNCRSLTAMACVALLVMTLTVGLHAQEEAAEDQGYDR